MTGSAFDAALPLELREALEAAFGEEDCARISAGFDAPKASSFRVNRLKGSAEGILKTAAELGIRAERLSWFEDGFVCGEGDDALLRQTEEYEAGMIYLQNPSSMVPPVMLDLREGLDVLDMCAAPGGKTTQIASMTLGRCGIMACENDKVRAERLRYNLGKQGVSASVSVTDARKLDDFFRFDRVLLDAPCSGSGTVQTSRSQTYRSFSAKLVRNCSALQYQLLKKAVTVLKKGGRMVYSTCSLLPAENDEVVRRILREGKVRTVPLPDCLGSLPRLECATENAILVCPTAEYEGFFAVALEKT